MQPTGEAIEAQGQNNLSGAVHTPKSLSLLTLGSVSYQAASSGAEASWGG